MRQHLIRDKASSKFFSEGPFVLWTPCPLHTLSFGRCARPLHTMSFGRYVLYTLCPLDAMSFTHYVLYTLCPLDALSFCPAGRFVLRYVQYVLSVERFVAPFLLMFYLYSLNCPCIESRVIQIRQELTVKFRVGTKKAKYCLYNKFVIGMT